MDDFLEYVDIVEEEINRQRLYKRYIRDHENPMGFFSDEEFRKRFRFSKATVVTVILPLVNEDLRTPDNRGLPISPLMQLLLCLRFYATCNFQVCYRYINNYMFNEYLGIL